MSKRRLLIVVISLLVLIVVGLPLIAITILPKDRIVQALSRQVEASSGWKLAVRDAGVRWPPLAIRLEDVVLSGHPAYEDSSRIAIPEARMVLDIFQIFKKQVRITKVDVDTPLIALYPARHPDREAIARLEEAASRPQEPGTLSLSLSGIDVKHGTLAWVDTTGMEVRLEEIAATLDLEAGAQMDQFDISGKLESPRFAVLLPPAPRAAGASRAPSDTAAARPIRLGDFEVRGETKLAFRPGDRTLAITEGTVSLNELRAGLTGMLREIGRQQSYEFAIDAKDADIEQLLSLVPESVLAEKEKLDASGRASIAAQVAGSSKPGSVPTASGTIVIGQSRIAFEGMPGAIEDLRGQIRFSNERLDIDSLFAAFDRAPFRLHGSVAPLDDPRVDLSIAGTLPLDMIGRWPVLAEYENLGGTVRLDARASGPVRVQREMRLDGRVDFDAVSVKPKAWSAGAEGLSGAIVFEGQSAQIVRLAGRMGQSDFSLSGAIDNPLAKPSLRANVTSKLLNLDELMKIAGGTAAASAQGNQPQAMASVQLPELPDINAAAQIRVDSLIAQAIPLRDAAGELTLENRSLRAVLTAREVGVPSSPLANARLDFTVRDRQLNGRFTAASAALPRVPLNDIAANIAVSPAGVIEITGANAKMFTGNVGGDVRVEFVNGEPRYTFSVAAKNLEANDFLSHLTPAKDLLFGKLELNGKFEGAGMTAEQAVAKLKADGAALAVDGQLKPHAVIGEIASVLGVPELREVNFRSLQSGFHIENGWMSLDGLDLIEPDAKWHLDGKMGFDGTLDYNVNIVLSKALADRAVGKLGDAARFLVTDKGELPIDLKIAGTATKPKVSVDMSGAAGRAKDAALREAAREAAERVGVDEKVITSPESLLKDPGSIGDLIGGVLGGKKPKPATPAPAPAPAPTTTTPPSTPKSPPAAPNTTAVAPPKTAPLDTTKAAPRDTTKVPPPPPAPRDTTRKDTTRADTTPADTTKPPPR
jgi:uncharacterized protein involved in outer membrane biogenesis